LLVVSTQPPLQTIWAPPSVHPVAQAGAWFSATVVQTGVPPSQLTPQAPQLSADVSETHAPLQRLNPGLHVTPHVLAVQEGMAFAAVVVHAFPQEPQLAGSDVVSTQVPLHMVDVPSGQVAMHANVCPEGAHSGVVPLHAVPHAPQFVGVLGSMQTPLHAIWAPVHPASSGVPASSVPGGAPPSPWVPASAWPPVVASPHLSPLHLSVNALRPEMDAHAPIASAATLPVASPMSHRTLSECGHSGREATLQPGRYARAGPRLAPGKLRALPTSPSNVRCLVQRRGPRSSSSAHTLGGR
jgi:hypothetical protein